MPPPVKDAPHIVRRIFLELVGDQAGVVACRQQDEERDGQADAHGKRLDHACAVAALVAEQEYQRRSQAGDDGDEKQLVREDEQRRRP